MAIKFLFSVWDRGLFTLRWLSKLDRSKKSLLSSQSALFFRNQSSFLPSVATLLQMFELSSELGKSRNSIWTIKKGKRSRSSNSRPDLLVIHHHPTFSDLAYLPLYNTDFHFLSHYSYIKSNHALDSSAGYMYTLCAG